MDLFDSRKEDTRNNGRLPCRETSGALLPAALSLQIMRGAQQEIAVLERVIAFARDAETVKRNVMRLKEEWQRADESKGLCEAIVRTREGGRLWREFAASLERWKRLHEEVVSLAVNTQKEVKTETLDPACAGAAAALNEAQRILDELISFYLKRGGDMGESEEDPRTPGT